MFLENSQEIEKPTYKTPDVRAKELVEKFGKDVALLVADELLLRDKMWIEKLSLENPEEWQISDYEKSVKIFDELKEAILKYQN